MEESGSKDLAEISKNLGAKEAEETEDLVKRNKGGQEMRTNSNKDRADIGEKLGAYKHGVIIDETRTEDPGKGNGEEPRTETSSKDLAESSKKLGTGQDHEAVEDDKETGLALGRTKKHLFPSLEEEIEGS